MKYLLINKLTGEVDIINEPYNRTDKDFIIVPAKEVKNNADIILYNNADKRSDFNFVGDFYTDDIELLKVVTYKFRI